MRIRLVQRPRDLAAFIDLPYRLHRDDPCWVPPLRQEIRTRLDRRANPFFAHGSADYFLAERAGATVGRIAAISNRLHDELHQDGVAFFGFFESVNDPAVAAELLAAAGTWAKSRGYRALRGPASFSVNEECGLLVEGFDSPPTLLMPHNPPYYAELIESAGLVKAKDLWAYQGGHPERCQPLPGRMEQALDRLGRRSGVALRAIDPRRFTLEVELMRKAYNAMWESNWGFVPMTAAEIRHMARQLKPLYIPELVPLAEKNGELVGFGLALPDVNQLLRTNRSGRLFPAVLRLLWALRRKKIRRARILLLGVKPEYRGRGLDAMLWAWIWSRAAQHGISWGEASWVLEDNPAMVNAAERMGFARYKTYRLYERVL